MCFIKITVYYVSKILVTWCGDLVSEFPCEEVSFDVQCSYIRIWRVSSKTGNIQFCKFKLNLFTIEAADERN